MKKVVIIFFVLSTMQLSAQDNPYYYQIPAEPSAYTAETSIARLVDGLGFRYFWATEGLTEHDLQFRPTDSSRTCYETLEHIYGLSTVLYNTVHKQSTKSGVPTKMTFTELRKKTLDNIEMASRQLKKEGIQLEELKMVFERASGNVEYPFWNLINGPISDALWHTGQVVSFRRSSGNPLPEGVNVLQGTKSKP